MIPKNFLKTISIQLIVIIKIIVINLTFRHQTIQIK